MKFHRQTVNNAYHLRYVRVRDVHAEIPNALKRAADPCIRLVLVLKQSLVGQMLCR